MSEESTELPPAGWYPDPEIPEGERYWDGEEWTEHRAPISAEGEVGSTWSNPVSRALAVAVYVFGVYLVLDLVVANPATEDFGFLYGLPAYSAVWGLVLGRWWALGLAVAILPGFVLWAIANDETIALEAGDELGYLGWALVAMLLSLPGLVLGVGARILARLAARSVSAAGDSGGRSYSPT